MSSFSPILTAVNISINQKRKKAHYKTALLPHRQQDCAHMNLLQELPLLFSCSNLSYHSTFSPLFYPTSNTSIHLSLPVYLSVFLSVCLPYIQPTTPILVTIFFSQK